MGLVAGMAVIKTLLYLEMRSIASLSWDVGGCRLGSMYREEKLRGKKLH